MELQQINQRIAVVNAESQRLNSERQQLIGRRQALEKQLNDLLAAYEKEYGVKLTVETIEAEVARVSALKEKEVSGIEAMLQLIKAGRYDEAERMASGVEHAGVTEVVPSVPEVPTQSSEMSMPTQVGYVGDPAQDAQPMQEMQEMQDGPVFAPPIGVPQVATQVPQETAQPLESAPMADVPVAPPSAPPAPEPPAAPVPPVFQRPVESPTQSQSGVPSFDAPPAPPPAPPKPRQPLGTPKLGVPPQVGTGTAPSGGMSFQAILNGSAFNPQQGG